MEAHKAQSSVVADVPEDDREVQSSELQATALRVLDEYDNKAREYEEKIRELRERHIPAAKSMYNSGARISQLSIELLTHIFRVAGPPRTSPADAIRLTHVCRSWRSVIHHTPAFWVDFLQSKTLVAHPRDSSIVLAALDRSAPLARMGFSMCGHFIPVLMTVPANVSRISTLRLDYQTGSAWFSDIRTFSHLQMPNLEDLTVWLTCHSSSSAFGKVQDPAAIPFPHLRRLRTNCPRLFLWIHTTLHELWLGTNRTSFDELYPAPAACCQIRYLHELWDALARCPNLQRLGLDDCLPYEASAAALAHLPVVAFSRLEVLQISGDTSIIRSVLERMLLPERTDVRFATNCLTDFIHELVPGRGKPLSCIPSIRRGLVVDIGDLANKVYKYTF